MPKPINAKAVEDLVKEHVKDESIKALKTDDVLSLFATQAVAEALVDQGISCQKMGSNFAKKNNLDERIFRISMKGLTKALGGKEKLEAAISGIHVIPFPDAVADAAVAHTVASAKTRLTSHAARVKASQSTEPSNERG